MPEIPLFPKLLGRMSELNIDQKKLAKMVSDKGISMSASSLSGKINGNRRFYLEEMKLICEILESEPKTIFFNVEYTKCKQEA